MITLSQYDEKLNDTAKQGIMTAKQSYANAMANNDKAGMAQANAYANSIRRTYGGYTGGDDGSGYYPVMEKPSYSSKYDKMISSAQKRIENIKDFTYNPEGDPMYKLYKKVYTQMGNDAYDRAMAQNSIKTGGIVNTNAAASAMQAQNFYNSALADKATELYNAAYKRYIDDINNEYDILNMYRQADDDDYSRYLDDVDAYRNERDFEYNRFNIELTGALDKIAAEAQAEYQAQRDKEEDRRWQAEFDYQKQQDAEDTLKWQKELDYKKNKSYNDYTSEMAKINRNYSSDMAKINSDKAKWSSEAEIKKYDSLIELANEIYENTYDDISLDEILDRLGL